MPCNTKDKVDPAQVIKTYRGNKGTAPLVIIFGTRGMCGQLHAPATLILGKKNPVFIE
jgi:hypothetical protein